MVSIATQRQEEISGTGISPAVINEPKAKTRYFIFLDGIRGITSLYVVFFHLIANGNSTLSITPLILNFFRFGHEAVVVFIVLSGFVLTLPLVNLADKKFPDGLGGFLKRRARRILPAYYMALLAYPLFILAIELLSNIRVNAIDWASIKQLFFSYNMLSHLLLLQNLKLEWSMASEYNIVIWSMATEWWIYFLFALLLVPIWRKMGEMSALGFSVLIGLVPLAMHLAGFQTIVGYPHLAGSFGLGMFIAILVSDRKVSSYYLVWRKRFLWAAGTAIVFFVLFTVAVPTIREDIYLISITDLLLSVACAAFIFILASTKLHIQNPGRLSSFFLRNLESRPVVFLGKISYSLYLTHVINFTMLGIILGLAPVKRLVNLTIEPLWVRLFIVIPFIILLAYCFYLLFEKPFLNKQTPGLPKASAAVKKVSLS